MLDRRRKRVSRRRLRACGVGNFRQYRIHRVQRLDPHVIQESLKMEISSKVRVSDLLAAEAVPANAEIAFHLSDDLYQSRRISYADLSA